MNYFAHGYLVLDDPYVVAGTALPDWLGASDRRARLRSERIRADGCPRIRSLAAGIRRHLEDDSWFHATEAFQRTWLELTQLLRDHETDSERSRAWFLAHVLLEMLIDRFLIRQRPERLDAYYAAIDSVDLEWLDHAVRPWLTRPPAGLTAYAEAFRRHRFLYGYLEDLGLYRRLAGVARRVGLPRPSEEVSAVLPAASGVVERRLGALMEAP